MVVTADAALADRARSLRTHGMATTSWERHRQRVSAYEIGELGFNYRIDEPRARLATMRLQKLDEENQARARIASEYASALQDLETVELLEAPAANEHQSHHLFVVVLAAGADRDGFRRALAERGVETGVHYRAIHDFELYEDSEVELPVTEDYAVRTVSLPLFPHMEQWQCELVIEAVHDAAGTG
jgi:dTDP-4-amino-4,6-dideoxygalactose transaminase